MDTATMRSSLVWRMYFGILVDVTDLWQIMIMVIHVYVASYLAL